jgi:hypothetical protein
MNNKNPNEEVTMKEEKFKRKLAIWHTRRKIMETLEKNKLFRSEIFAEENKLKLKFEKENYDDLFWGINEISLRTEYTRQHIESDWYIGFRKRIRNYLRHRLFFRGKVYCHDDSEEVLLRKKEGISEGTEKSIYQEVYFVGIIFWIILKNFQSMKEEDQNNCKAIIKEGMDASDKKKNK